MKIRSVYTVANLTTVKEVVRVIRSWPINLPSGITNNSFQTKGGILVGTGVGTYGEHAAGADGETVIYDSTAPDGVKTGLPSTSVMPAAFERDIRFTGSHVTILTPNTMWVNINGVLRIINVQSSIALGIAGNWDSVTPDYTVAANRAGKQFYLYACENGVTAPKLLLSVNASAPTGYTTLTSRLIGGFHCLCVAVGVIAGHTLSGYVAGDILPQSVWDLKWCPRRNSNGTYKAGMVYSAAANIWVDIYLMSGTGTSTLSVNGGVVSDTRDWMDFIDDAGAVEKRLLRDREFQLAAAGCNEGTNITGSVDPTTTGGHTDTAGRRMISNIGCEDMAGVMWQWLDEQSYRYDAGTWSWKNVTGGKGQLFTQDSYGDVKLLAGGSWGAGAYCGSRSRDADSSRGFTNTGIGGRAGVEPE